jgi:RNA polymerase sigma factor (sigma-70 family)
MVKLGGRGITVGVPEHVDDLRSSAQHDKRLAGLVVHGEPGWVAARDELVDRARKKVTPILRHLVRDPRVDWEDVCNTFLERVLSGKFLRSYAENTNSGAVWEAYIGVVAARSWSRMEHPAYSVCEDGSVYVVLHRRRVEDQAETTALKNGDPDNTTRMVDGFDGMVKDAAAESDPGEQLISAEVIRELKNALENSLNDGQREAIRLCYFLGLTEREAGARLGIKKAAVSRRLQRAFVRLREELEGRL